MIIAGLSLDDIASATTVVSGLGGLLLGTISLAVSMSTTRRQSQLNREVEELRIESHDRNRAYELAYQEALIETQLVREMISTISAAKRLIDDFLDLRKFGSPLDESIATQADGLQNELWKTIERYKQTYSDGSAVLGLELRGLAHDAKGKLRELQWILRRASTKAEEESELTNDDNVSRIRARLTSVEQALAQALSSAVSQRANKIFADMRGSG